MHNSIFIGMFTPLAPYLHSDRNDWKYVYQVLILVVSSQGSFHLLFQYLYFSVLFGFFLGACTSYIINKIKI